MAIEVRVRKYGPGLSPRVKDKGRAFCSAIVVIHCASQDNRITKHWLTFGYHSTATWTFESFLALHHFWSVTYCPTHIPVHFLDQNNIRQRLSFS